MAKQVVNDFSKGSIISNILRLSIPMTLAQLINVLYSIVDRIYIGRMGENSSLALTGVGVCLPIITIVIAFANLIGMGGSPLFSIKRGEGNEKEAEAILGNSVTLLVIFGLCLTVVGLIVKRPLLYLLGASENTIEYANSYITIYLLGNVYAYRRNRSGAEYYFRPDIYIYNGRTGCGTCDSLVTACRIGLDV